MATSTKHEDPRAVKIHQILETGYRPGHSRAEIKAYAYNSASVRVRVIDPDFEGKSARQREEAVWLVLSQLPERVRGDISMLLLLTPRESASSLISLEFDDPSRSFL